MPIELKRTVLPATIALALCLASARQVRADEKEACVSASEEAQTLRDEGKYRAARAAMLTCARDVCPGIVRRDCEKWLTELDSAQPTLVIGARDPRGNDLAGTHVFLDGAPLVDHLDGKPVAVDPGEHVLRYEALGAAPVEQRVIVRVNEKNRMLTVILMPRPGASAGAAVGAASSVSSPASSSTSSAPPAASADATSPTASRINPAAWVFSATALVGVGGFIVLGLSGQSNVTTLRNTCAPNCTEGQVDSARAMLLGADISLGLGVVSAGLATYFFIRRDRPHAQVTGMELRPDVQMRPGGGVATISGRF